jgi:hypothetical protein
LDHKEIYTQQINPNAALLQMQGSTPVALYSLNVLLNTVLFLVVFMSATAWTSASVNAVQKVPGAWKLFVLAAVLTVITLGLAIGFGVLSQSKSGLNVSYTNTIASALAVVPPQRKPTPFSAEDAYQRIQAPLVHLYGEAIPAAAPPEGNCSNDGIIASSSSSSPSTSSSVSWQR